VSEPYRSPDWALVPAKPAQVLNTNNNNNKEKKKKKKKKKKNRHFPLSKKTPGLGRA
jgi:hypothetical protein